MAEGLRLAAATAGAASGETLLASGEATRGDVAEAVGRAGPGPEHADTSASQHTAAAVTTVRRDADGFR